MLNRLRIPGTFIWIDNIPQRRVTLRIKGRLSHGTAFSNRVFYGKNKISRNPRDFRAIRVSVLHIFIAAANVILRFSAKSKIIIIKKKVLTGNEVTPYSCTDFGFVYKGQVVYRNWSTFSSIVRRRRTSWPFPRREYGLVTRSNDKTTNVQNTRMRK